MRRDPNIDWSDTDWSQPVAEIARKKGCSVHAVYAARKRLHVRRPETWRPYNPAIDWSGVDWSLHNSVIAQRLGVTENTVSHARKQMGAPRSPQRPYRDAEIRRARIVAVRNPDAYKLAVAAAKSSIKSGRGPENVHAKIWRIESPFGQIFEAKNLYHFVREHAHLFAREDAAWKRRGTGKRGTGGEYCNATAGLLGAAAGKARAWKGWKIKEVRQVEEGQVR